MRRPLHDKRKPEKKASLSGARYVVIVAIVATLAAGALWLWPGNTQTVALSEVSHIHGIAVDPSDRLRLFLATHQGVYRTDINGRATRVSENQDDYMGFSLHPSEPGLVYASGHSETGGNLGVIASTDGGQRWTQLSPGANGPVDFHGIAISRANADILYGIFGGIQVSTNGGESWATAGLAPADVIDLAASASNPDFIYAATVTGLKVSRDRGRSWEATGSQDQTATMVETAPDGTVYAFVIGSGLIKSPVAALSWSALNSNFDNQAILHLAVDPSDPQHLFAVTDDDKILNSSDGGRNWKPLA